MDNTIPFCFISYSRHDAAIARWLQHELESYKYPHAMVKPDRRPLDRIHLRPVFLDTSDLPTSAETFWDKIVEKIDQSRYLLVLCSRASAASAYVDKEIERFIGGDEARLDRIILAIIDPKINLSSPSVDDFPPQIIQRWERLSSRNHPQVRPTENETPSAARKRGLFQIVSFMLGVEWIVLFNRYLIKRRKTVQRAVTISIAVLMAIVISLAWALWKEQELTTFERKIFPYSLVVGYVDNFLSPVITSLDKTGRDHRIIISLPAAYDELEQDKRVAKYRSSIESAGYALEPTRVETKLPRGAVTAKIVPTPPYYDSRNMDLYIDFASTVTAFRNVIEYKKSNPAYARNTDNQMLIQYVDEFEKSVMEQLPEHQRSRVVFVRSPEEALQVLQGQ